MSGTSQTRGSAGGRVALYAQAEVYLGDVNVDGEWLSNPGSIFIGGNYFSSSIDIDQGTLIFDTKSGSFFGEEEPMELGHSAIPLSLMVTMIHGPTKYAPSHLLMLRLDQVKVILRGDKPLVIQTVAGGDFYTAADFILDGGDASSTSGYGGLGVLNPWSGQVPRHYLDMDLGDLNLYLQEKVQGQHTTTMPVVEI